MPLPLQYITPGGTFQSHYAFGYTLAKFMASGSAHKIADEIMWQSRVNSRECHCRIGRITLKEAK